MAGHVAERVDALGLLAHLGRILEAIELLQTHAALEDLVDEGRDLVEPADQQGGKAGEGDDVADPQLPPRHQQRADDHHHHHRNGRGDAMHRAGQRPPVEHRILCLDQPVDEDAQRLGFLRDTIVALQQGDVADGIADMGEHLVVVRLDGLLVLLGPAHHEAADREIQDAQHHQHQREAVVDGDGGRDQQHQRHGGGQMLAHEFEPEPEQRVDGADQGVQDVRGAALVVPRQRHRHHVGIRARQDFDAHAMRETVRLAGDEDEGDDVEETEAGPQHQCRDHVTLVGDDIDDAAEEDRLGDHHHCQDDVGAADDQHAPALGGKIVQSPPIDFQQCHSLTPPASLCNAPCREACRETMCQSWQTFRF